MGRKQPRMVFRYSFIYDELWSLALNKDFDMEAHRGKFDSFIRNFKKHWTEKRETKVMQLISKYSGLNWKDDKILVYFVNNLNVSGFSDPLTIKINEDYLGTCEALLHELIHVILSQNEEKVSPVIEHLNKVFLGEERGTILHLIVNSIDRRVFSEVFGEDKFEVVSEKVSRYRGLRRSYEILEELYPRLGSNILDSLLKL